MYDFSSYTIVKTSIINVGSSGNDTEGKKTILNNYLRFLKKCIHNSL